MLDRLSAALLATLLGAAPAAAQGTQAEREVTAFGQVRVRGELRDNADFDDSSPDRQRFFAQRTRLGLEVRVSPKVEGRVVAQDSRLWGTGGATTADTGTERQSLDLLEGYADLRWIWDLPLDLRLGRQQLAYGRERLIGAFDFSQAGRAFDAYRIHFGMGALSFDILSAKLADTNAPGPAGSPSPAFSDEDRNFSGIYLARQSDSLEALELYWLRDIDKTRERAEGETKRSTFGVRGRYALPHHLTAEGEVAAQTGSAAGDSLDVSAQMVAFELVYARRDLRGLEAAFGVDWASGDGDPADRDLETFDQLFPTAHNFLGAMDYVGRQNIRDLRARIGARLLGSIDGELHVHAFRLDEAADAWYDASGGVTQAGKARVFGPDPARASRDLGEELDLLFRFGGFAGAAIEGGYSRFFAGDLIGLGGAPADDSDWAYIQVRVDL